MTNANHRVTYTARDLALIIPTKDRPEKLGELLDSLVGQSAVSGRVIVIDGAASANEIVSDFQASLPIEYYQSPVPGQIYQRNMGIAKLGGDNRLIGFLDDDLVLEPDAFEEILKLWNSVETETAGIGLNMVNMPRHKYSRIKGLFFLDHPEMGRVLKSGMNTGINNISKNINTQWLGGGYTFWRREILENYPQESIKTRWAIGEDLRYSYPIGKHYPLYVCKRARAHHYHVYDQAKANEVASYRGERIGCASVCFALRHRELSLFACYWMLIGLSLGRLMRSLIERDRHGLQEVLGQVRGGLHSLGYIGGHRSMQRLLEDD